MNYIEQINVFWRLDAEYSFNGNETRLYFYLLDLSNSLYWKNPLTNADGYTANKVGISVNTLKTVRNKLQQVGLISFKPGGNGAKNKCQYMIIPSSQVLRNNAGKVSDFDTLSEETLTPYLIPGLGNFNDINKLKPDKKKTREKAAPKNNGVVEEKKFVPLVGTLIGDMRLEWQNQNPRCFIDENENKELLAIARKINNWLGHPGPVTEFNNIESTGLKWVDIVKHCKEDPHLQKYSIAQVNKHFSSVIQSLNNGNTNGSKRKGYSHQPVITGTAEGSGSL